jgi:hypothetical protein
MNSNTRLADMQAAQQAIHALELSDLRLLNRLIVDRINYLNSVQQRVQLQKFTVGDRVRFRDAQGQTREGVVKRVNRKTLSIQEGQDDGWWRISPKFVSLAN